jgi:hypothetical protein
MISIRKEYSLSNLPVDIRITGPYLHRRKGQVTGNRPKRWKETILPYEEVPACIECYNKV